MSKKIKILGKNHIPKEGALIIPGRLDYQEMLELEHIFSGRKIMIAREMTKINEEFIRGDVDEIKELTKSLPVGDLNILTTFGDKGASIGNIHVDAKPISPVNTNGAGDALIGVFLALKNKYNKKESQNEKKYNFFWNHIFKFNFLKLNVI